MVSLWSVLPSAGATVLVDGVGETTAGSRDESQVKIAICFSRSSVHRRVHGPEVWDSLWVDVRQIFW